MKRSKEELDNARHFLNEAIKMGVQLDLEKEDAEPILTREDMERLNISPPPDDMFERIMKACKSDKSPMVSKGFRSKKVLLIAAVITIFLASALSVQAVRMYIYKIGVQIMENGANLIGINIGEVEIFDIEDAEAYNKAESELGHKLLKPSYLPKGIKLQELKVYGESTLKLLFANDDNSLEIRFEQEIIQGGISTGTLLDTKNALVFQDNINGYEVTIGKATQGVTNDVWLIGRWSDDKLIYTLTANVDKNELIKIIKGLE